MDIVDLVNDFIDNRKTERASENSSSTPESSVGILKNIDYKLNNNTTNMVKTNRNIQYYADLVNQGEDPSKIEERFNLPYGLLEELLLANNFKFYSFMNYWTKLEEKELFNELILQLNTGNTLYDLSGKYLKGNKERLRFVSMVEKLLDRYHYSYNKSLKVWEEEEPNNKRGISLIVDELNNGKPLKEVASQFEVTPASLRISLKSANYRYDPLFKVWTLLTRKELVKNLAKDLDSGKVTLEELELRGYNLKELESELKYITTYAKLSHKSISNESSEEHIIEAEVVINQLENDNKPITHPSPSSQEGNTTKVRESEKAIPFTESEIKIIKDIISFWSEEKETYIQRKEINVLIDSVLLENLNKTSEIEGLSKSKIIEKALIAYLKN
jgi:hypothetical protein